MKKFFLLILALCILGIFQNNFAQSNLVDDEINLAEVKIEIKRDGSSMAKSVFNFYGAPKELDDLQKKVHGIIIKLQQND